MLKRINDHIIGFEARLFSIILAVFILALWSGVQQWMGKFLFVIHLALFLLWQPFFQKDVPVKYTQALVFLGLLLCMVVTLNYWSLSGWAVFLIGVLGGRVAPSESSEKCYLGFFGILLSILLLVLMPKAVGVDVFQSEQETSLFFGCLLLPLIYSGWIKRESAEVTPDLFQSINAVLFIFFISMGVLVVHAYFPFTYLEALITWLLISSISILLIFWWLFPGGGSHLKILSIYPLKPS